MFTRKPITCENTKTRRETDMMRTYFLHVGLVAAILATSITHCASAQASELEVSGSRLSMSEKRLQERGGRAAWTKRRTDGFEPA